MEFSPKSMHRTRVTVLGLLRTKGTRWVCDRHSREHSPALPLSPGGDVTRLALVTASRSWAAVCRTLNWKERVKDGYEDFR